MSARECVYRCMPELWLRKIFPQVAYVKTDLPGKRIRVAKTQQELDELEHDSAHIYKANIIEQYTIATVDRLCLAEFASYYYKEYKSDSTSNVTFHAKTYTNGFVFNG